MQPTPIAALVLILGSAGSAYLVTRRLQFALRTSTGLLALLILWQSIEIISVQLAAGLQMCGWIARVDLSSIAKYQLLLLGGMALWDLLRPPGQDFVPGSDSNVPQPWPAYLRAATVVLLGSYLAMAVDVFTGYPSGSDSLIYHLPLAVRWLQDGSLAIPVSRAWQQSMPANAEIGMMILLSSGKQSIVILASWIPALILLLSIFELGVWISPSDRMAAISACLVVLSIPMIQFQVFSAYVDLLGSAGILAAFALLLGRRAKTAGQDPALTPKVVFLASLACGISIGTKPVYYFYGLVFCVVLVALVWADRERGAKALAQCLLLAGLGMLLPSVFWFARGWTQTGNPLFPIEVKIGQRMIFPGYPPSQITHRDFEFNFVRKPSEWAWYPWTEWKRTSGYLEIPYGEGEGFGGAFATFVPLGILFFVFQCFELRAKRRRNWTLLLVFMALVLSWWVWMERVLRFGQVIWIFACVLAVPLIREFEHWGRRSFRWLLVAAIAATSLICASVAMHSTLGRFRKQLWSRSQIYNYPQFID